MFFLLGWRIILDAAEVVKMNCAARVKRGVNKCFAKDTLTHWRNESTVIVEPSLAYSLFSLPEYVGSILTNPAKAQFTGRCPMIVAAFAVHRGPAELFYKGDT